MRRTSHRLALISMLAALVAACASAPAVAGQAQIAVDQVSTDDGVQQVGHLVYTAGPGERNGLQISFGSEGVDTLVDPAGVTPGPGCTRPDPGRADTATCVESFDTMAGLPARIDLGDGDDTLVMAGAPAAGVVDGQGAVIVGGPGNDTLGGTESDDLFVDGPGRDSMSGGWGDDAFDLSLGGGAADRISGGPDDDMASYAQLDQAGNFSTRVGRRKPVRMSLDGKANDGQARERDNIVRDVERLVGGRGNDVLTGERHNDTLFGLGGNDRLTGGPGDDELQGGTGNDRLAGAEGADALFGSSGNDSLNGGRDADRMEGGTGRDRLYARDGTQDLARCNAAVDRANFDSLDVDFDCERVKRRGRPVAGVVLSAIPDDDLILDFGSPVPVAVGCPNDSRHKCRGRVTALIAGARAGSAKFTVKPDRLGRVNVPIAPTSFQAIGDAGVDATVLLTSRDGAGRARTRRYVGVHLDSAL